MKKTGWLVVMLLTMGIAQAQTEKPVKKDGSNKSKTEKMAQQPKDHTATKTERKPVTINPDQSEPAPDNSTPASPGTNAGTDTPLNAPSNMSNASPANNGTPQQGAPKQ